MLAFSFFNIFIFYTDVLGEANWSDGGVVDDGLVELQEGDVVVVALELVVDVGPVHFARYPPHFLPRRQRQVVSAQQHPHSPHGEKPVGRTETTSTKINHNFSKLQKPNNMYLFY